MNRHIIVGLLLLGLSGCYSRYFSNRKITSRVVKDEYSTTIYLDKNSKSDHIRIDKVINSNCFCADAIAEKYVNRRIVYRLYYGCSIYKTRKELFNYCSRGAVMGPRLLDGTTAAGTDYKTSLDATDKFVLHKIDSFIQTEGKVWVVINYARRTSKGLKILGKMTRIVHKMRIQ